MTSAEGRARPPKREFGLRDAAPRWWLLLFALLGLSLYFYLGRRPSPSGGSLGFEGRTMGTSYSVLLGEPQPVARLSSLKDAVDALLRELNASMSTYEPTAEISRFNRHASTEPFTASEGLAEVVAMAQNVSRVSAGAFDITVGPLVDAWGFGPGGRVERAPSEEEQAELRKRVGYAKLSVEEHRLTKSHPELRIDLSAIAKGYAVDKIVELLETRGHERYLVEIGGELRARGRSARGEPFRVGIEEPSRTRRTPRVVIELDGLSLATSGNYRNAFELDGQLYSHTIDPTTGRPAAHQLTSASVLHPSCAMADAWATALMAAGPDKAWKLAESAGLDALLLVAEEGGKLNELATPGFLARRVSPKP